MYRLATIFLVSIHTPSPHGLSVAPQNMEICSLLETRTNAFMNGEVQVLIPLSILKQIQTLS